jgi:hypothetical protein
LLPLIDIFVHRFILKRPFLVKERLRGSCAGIVYFSHTFSFADTIIGLDLILSEILLKDAAS